MPWERAKKKKVCPLCQRGIGFVDYKEVDLLKEFLGSRWQIIPRRRTGVCAKHQRQLARAIKNARELGLLPYISEHSLVGRNPK